MDISFLPALPHVAYFSDPQQLSLALLGFFIFNITLSPFSGFWITVALSALVFAIYFGVMLVGPNDGKN
eukprot:812148-Amorphochlora_amoeboformis.AAC.1